MNWNCLLGHDYERVGEIKPIKYDGEFNYYVYKGHFALGRCRRCSKKTLVQCSGTWRYYPSDMLTKLGYLESIGENNSQENQNQSD